MVAVLSPQAALARTEAIIPGAVSPDGFTLPGGVVGSSSGFFAEIGDIFEASWISLNEDYIGLSAPCDLDCIRMWDQDSYTEVFSISNVAFSWSPENAGTKYLNVDSDDSLSIRVGGELLNIFTDPDNDTGRSDGMRVYNNGTSLVNRIFQIDWFGNLEIGGALTHNYTFDLAEAFWMTGSSGPDTPAMSR